MCYSLYMTMVCLLNLVLLSYYGVGYTALTLSTDTNPLTVQLNAVLSVWILVCSYIGVCRRRANELCDLLYSGECVKLN